MLCFKIYIKIKECLDQCSYKKHEISVLRNLLIYNIYNINQWLIDFLCKMKLELHKIEQTINSPKQNWDIGEFDL